jgi:hypothetical protein
MWHVPDPSGPHFFALLFSFCLVIILCVYLVSSCVSLRAGTLSYQDNVLVFLVTKETQGRLGLARGDVVAVMLVCCVFDLVTKANPMFSSLDPSSLLPAKMDSPLSAETHLSGNISLFNPTQSGHCS